MIVLKKLNLFYIGTILIITGASTNLSSTSSAIQKELQALQKRGLVSKRKKLFEGKPSQTNNLGTTSSAIQKELQELQKRGLVSKRKKLFEEKLSQTNKSNIAQKESSKKQGPQEKFFVPKYGLIQKNLIPQQKQHTSNKAKPMEKRTFRKTGSKEPRKPSYQKPGSREYMLDSEVPGTSIEEMMMLDSPFSEDKEKASHKKEKPQIIKTPKKTKDTRTVEEKKEEQIEKIKKFIEKK